MINKQISLWGYLDNNEISCELALFTDGGVFYNQSKTRRMADAGVGIRIGGNIYNKPLYLRLDFPFFLLKNNKFINNDNQWVISFQKGI